jgi:putative DNA primase/helicase
VNRPTALSVNVAGIPDALKAERRWVCWRYELRSGRWAKILCTVAGYHAKSNDPTTWTTFDDALAAYQTGRFDGVGFVLGDGWAGIDLDDMLSGSVVDRLPCYREISPSGTGIKAVGRANRIGGEIKGAAFTTWTGGRYFAITGHGHGDPNVDISALIAEWFPARTPTRPSLSFADRPAFIREGDTRGTENIEVKTDDQVLTLAATAINRDKFLKLFRGDLSDYGDDHSRADQALVNILLYWCHGDTAQADRLFRQSALMRDKWDSESYRRSTLSKAAAMLREAV